MVNGTSLNFSTETPTENESITINATIYNLGGADISSVDVKFYNGDPKVSGTQIGSTQTISIDKYSSNITSISWDAPLGTSEVFVTVDPPISTNGSFD